MHSLNGMRSAPFFNSGPLKASLRSWSARQLTPAATALISHKIMESGKSYFATRPLTASKFKAPAPKEISLSYEDFSASFVSYEQYKKRLAPVHAGLKEKILKEEEISKKIVQLLDNSFRMAKKDFFEAVKQRLFADVKEGDFGCPHHPTFEVRMLERLEAYTTIFFHHIHEEPLDAIFSEVRAIAKRLEKEGGKPKA